MEAIRVQHTVQKSGELKLKNLPVQKGQQIEVLVLFPLKTERPHLTARQLLQSDLIGLWKDREIKDSAQYARDLREKAQRRPGIGNDDSAR